ncbi:MAG: pyridoxamine 5'-phosphate oxidase family protein [Micropruina sp.]
MHHDDPVATLSEESCWSLLAEASVGRLATVIDRQPDIFPVNFVLDGPSVVFRTAEGSKLLQLVINSGVAFEADSWDEDSAWSVVIKGDATEVTDPVELATVEELALRPWVPTVKQHVVRITPREVAGRRFRFGPEPQSPISTAS